MVLGRELTCPNIVSFIHTKRAVVVRKPGLFPLENDRVVGSHHPHVGRAIDSLGGRLVLMTDTALVAREANAAHTLATLTRALPFYSAVHPRTKVRSSLVVFSVC